MSATERPGTWRLIRGLPAGITFKRHTAQCQNLNVPSLVPLPIATASIPTLLARARGGRSRVEAHRETFPILLCRPGYVVLTLTSRPPAGTLHAGEVRNHHDTVNEAIRKCMCIFPP